MLRMRLLKRILILIAALLGTICLALWASGNIHILYGIRKTYLIGKPTPDIDDMHHFDVRKITASFPKPTEIYSAYNVSGLTQEETAWIDSMGTTALLVYCRDSLLFEHYKEGDESTLSNSFSMAKSITSVLIGMAIDDGYIGSINDPVGRYLTDYNTGLDTNLTIRHLLEMTSGIPFGESYNSPLGFMAKAYYGRQLEEAVLKYHVQEMPGKKWAYEGGNTQLLGMVLKSATGMTVSDYCALRLWGPLGAEHDAYWNLDHADGLEKTFSGFYATARDFARLGKLFLHDGIVGGDTIINPQWVRKSISPIGTPDEHGELCSWYGWQWWLGEHNDHAFFMMRGLRGQYVVCIPDLDLILVRLGHIQSKERVRHMPADLFRYIDMAIRLSPLNNR